MFEAEAALRDARRKMGQRKAIELVADINAYTARRTPRQPASLRKKPDLKGQRCLFDLNEHFVELSNPGEEDRSLMLVLNGAIVVATLVFAFVLAWALVQVPLFSRDGLRLVGIGTCVGLLPLGYFTFGWSSLVAPTFFTVLGARYRFNRSTRKVYVLRPARYGGNVVLDWDRVEAHVRWCAPRGMTHRELRDPVARETRQTVGRGPLEVRGLVLYWPPLDPQDPQRQGEEALWVGPNGAGRGLWEFLRAFMEEGLDKVPQPQASEWRRKGFQTPEQYLAESVLVEPESAMRRRSRQPQRPAHVWMSDRVAALKAHLHCLAQRFCSWPTFPAEWNSDSGMRRREDGIGPEEPLRWEAR